MARTKQTARKSTGGKAPRQMLAAKSATAFRAFMTGRQAAQFQSKTQTTKKTSYLNCENMFYSYGFSTGKPVDAVLAPQFVSAIDKNPITNEENRWLGMTLNSKFDGAGMQKYGRPDLNLVVVLDISGSMCSSFSQDWTGERFQSKMEVAKKCLIALTGQLRKGDKFGLVLFNHMATVAGELKPWSKKWIGDMKKHIASLSPGGMTDLTKAALCATNLFDGAGEGKRSSNRMVFLLDLNSTVDSAADEKNLLSTLKKNAAVGLYTTVVGIGMDLNVELVTQISKTRGARYCSVDSPEEFDRIITKEFPYDVTLIGFDIEISIGSGSYVFLEGFGSPELSGINKKTSVTLSSEFPSPHDENGEAKGGMLLFKVGLKKGKKPTDKLSVTVTWKDLSGISQKAVSHVPMGQRPCKANVPRRNLITGSMESVRPPFISPGNEGTAIRKAIALVRYVDLHNEYVLDKKTHLMKYLELFQRFREYFIDEMKAIGDKSIETNNKGDVELLDKIIELESDKGKAPSTAAAVAPSARPQIPVPVVGPLPRFTHVRGAPPRRAQLRRAQPRRALPSPKPKIKVEPKIKAEPKVGTRRSSRLAGMKRRNEEATDGNRAKNRV